MQKLDYQAFLQLLRWVARGKTLTRAMLNVRLKNLRPMEGVVIDLGGGGVPSYLEQMEVRGVFLNMDRAVEVRPSVVGNLEKSVPIANESVDSVILFNTLEHVYDVKRVAEEMHRILKPHGVALIYSPFIFPYHTHKFETSEIQDYFRLSEAALRRLFLDAGFSKLDIEPMGGIFFVITEYFGFVLRYSVLRTMAFLCAYPLERLFRALRPGLSNVRYPLAYWISATK